MTTGPFPIRPMLERIVVVGCAGSGKTTLAREIAVRLDAGHIGRDALGDDEAPGFAARVAAAVVEAGRRWVFDGAPYNAEELVYPHADALVALDYPRRVVWRRVVARSLRLWLTRRADGAHTSNSPPWRWWAPTHQVRWAVQTHAARHEEIAGLLTRPELAYMQRFRFTSPRQAEAHQPSPLNPAESISSRITSPLRHAGAGPRRSQRRSGVPHQDRGWPAGPWRPRQPLTGSGAKRMF
jgi:hypothetical protein